MIELKGNYTGPDDFTDNYAYSKRVRCYLGKWYDMVSQEVEVKNGDILRLAGNGTWFALYVRVGKEPPDRYTPEQRAAIQSGMFTSSALAQTGGEG